MPDTRALFDFIAYTARLREVEHGTTGPPRRGPNRWPSTPGIWQWCAGYCTRSSSGRAKCGSTWAGW